MTKIVCMTEWRPVVGFEDRYRVSDDGQVYSIRKGANIYQHTLNHGHKMVALFRGDRGNLGHRKLVHHLILEAFVGSRPEGKECLHENDVPSDNRLENLRWGTRSENAQDAMRNGKNWGDKKRTRCKRGHQFTPETTYIDSRGDRACKTCKHEYVRTPEYREKQRLYYRAKKKSGT